MRPKTEPNTYGWNTVAVTEEWKASMFCNVIETKNHERERDKKKPLKMVDVKKEWKFFVLTYCSILTEKNAVSIENMVETEALFGKTKAMAMLGHGSFSDYKEDHQLKDADKYDSFNYFDANYF